MLSWEFLRAELLGHELIATFFGVFAGIPAALWVDRRIKSKELGLQHQKRLEKERDVLLLLKEELEFSKQGLDVKKANPTDLHMQPFKTDVWEAFSTSGMLTFIDSPELLNRIASAYYAVQIVRKIEETCYTASRSATVTFSGGKTAAQILLADARGFDELLESNLNEALNAINERVSVLQTRH